MPKDKRSFFERLTGSVPAEEYIEEEEQPQAHFAVSETKIRPTPSKRRHAKIVQEEDDYNNDPTDEEEEGQLTVDVFQTPNEIIVQSTVAGVHPDDLDVSVTRDQVTLRGKREQTRDIEDENFFYQELYWGTFSRSITLPQEVDVDGVEATLKNGLLTVRLPKLDKNRIQRVKVKNN